MKNILHATLALKGDKVPLIPQSIFANYDRYKGHSIEKYVLCTSRAFASDLSVGSEIFIQNIAYFKMVGSCLLPEFPMSLPILEVLQDIPFIPKRNDSNIKNIRSKKTGSEDASLKDISPENTSSKEIILKNISVEHKGFSCAIITLSDKGFADTRQDESGATLLDLVQENLSICHIQQFLLPDNPAQLRALVLQLAVDQGYNLIISTGGTGISPTDLTPEALLPILDARLQGFEIAMMQESLQITPRAMISRALAGRIHKSLIFAIPGSIKGSAENIRVILPVLKHALDKLNGDTSNCGRI